MNEVNREPGDRKASNAAIFAEIDGQQEAADELRSRTQALAESGSPERKSDRFLVGMITAVFQVTEFDHPFFGPVFMGARSRLIAADCDLLLCANQPARPGDPLRAVAVERTISRGVDALLVWGIGDRDPEIAPILESGLPSVFVDNDPVGRRVAHVMSDNVSGMTTVVDHLYERGRGRIAHIAGLQNTRAGIDRLFGYRSQLSQLGLPGPDDYAQQGDFYPRSGREATERLLQLPEPPDAITCASDMMAIGALLAIEDAGLRVPGDIAVTGFDDVEFATRLSPTLTTVRQDAFGLGTAAAEALLRMLFDPDAAPNFAVLATELVVRESSAPAGT